MASARGFPEGRNALSSIAIGLAEGDFTSQLKNLEG